MLGVPLKGVNFVLFCQTLDKKSRMETSSACKKLTTLTKATLTKYGKWAKLFQMVLVEAVVSLFYTMMFPGNVLKQ
jgi:hypothetical protein